MCGVFGISNYVKFDLAERFGFGAEEVIPEMFRKTTFQPHSDVLTVSRNSPNKLIIRHWSLVPPWVEDLTQMKFPTFNARSESLREKPTFRNAWSRGQRCIVVATEFYEYRDNGKGKPKTPFKFTLNNEPFAIAGLYQHWRGLETVTIITSEPNYDSKDIHDRLPVVLHREDEEKWLNKETSLEDAYKLLVPYSDGALTIEETVSPLKRTPKINSK